MTLANSFAAKLAVASVAIAMMFSVVATPAQAQTAAELQAMIDTLMAQITALQAQIAGGGSSSAVCEAYVFTRPLTVGATGADVTALQNYLISEGYSIPAGATGYFGSQTKAAVAAWQAANGVSPAVGYFGPISQAKYDALMAVKCAASSDDSSSDDSSSDDSSSDDNSGATLGNGEGSIDSVTQASPDESSLKEGGQEGGVLAFDVKIDGDVEINRVDVYAEEQAVGTSNNADDYFTEASLWVDGDKVATLDVSDFNEDDWDVVSNDNVDEYRLRFSGLNLVFADNDEPEFQVAFKTVNNIDSADLNASWVAELDSIRYVDGEGFADSEDNIGISETFGVEQEDVAELEVSESDNNPDADVIKVDDNNKTNDVPFLVFDIEEKTGVDATVEDMTVTIVALSSTSAPLAEDAVVASAAIYDGSTKLDSANVPSNGIVQFQNMGLDINADDKVELTVKLDLEDTNNQTAYQDGTTVKVDYTSIDDAVDENGNDENDMTISGSANGNVMTLREVGAKVHYVSDETSVIENDTATNADDEGKFKLVFDVEAFGDDLYLPFGSSRTMTMADGVIWEILDDNNAVVATGTTTPSLDVADSNVEMTNSYKITDGSTEKFTLTVLYDPAAAGAYKLRVKKINYALTDVATATDSQDVSALDIDTDKEVIQN